MESMSLTALAREQLAVARSGSAGRSAVTVHGRHDDVLRQTLIALVIPPARHGLLALEDAVVLLSVGTSA